MKKKTTEDPADAAFLASKGARELFGEPLRAYSASRAVAAQSMGLKFPYLGKEDATAYNKTNIYPGALLDAIIVLWLCSIKDLSEITDGEWSPARALSYPDEARGAAIEWAGEKGFANTQAERFKEAWPIFVAIVLDVQDSKFAIKTPGSEAEDDDGPKV